MLTEIQKDKIKGTIYGQAIGDALGLGTEFMSMDEVQIYYQNGLTNYGEIIQDDHRCRWKRGDWTDDTDQAVCIIESIFEDGDISPEHFAAKLYQWFQGSPMGIGLTVYKVLSMPKFTSNFRDAAELVWKMSGRKSAANGAIMRTSIIGVWDYWNRATVWANAEKISKVTHFDPRCVGSSVIVSEAIRSIVNNGILLTANDFIKIADKYDSSIGPYIQLASKDDLENLNLDDKDSMGYTLKTMAAGLWAYFHAKDFNDGLKRIIHQGGDADTNGAVAGSLLGAKFGFKTIPENYVQGLIRNNELNEMIERLTSMIEQRLIKNMK
jgi:ADP-ribosylglycohydrolase